MSTKEDMAYDAQLEREHEDRKANPNREDVIEAVVGFICDQFGLMADEVDINDHFENSLHADDFDRSEIAGACEELYGFAGGSIPSKDLETVSALVDHICKRLGITD